MKQNKAKKIISALLSFPAIKEASKHFKMTESTIYNYLKDEEIPPQTRLNASRTVLEYGIKLTESIDILPRIKLLEQAQKPTENEN